MSWIQAVLALIKAIPWFQEKFDELMVVYVKWRVESHDKEFTSAMLSLINNHDQTKLEEAIGSDNAGKPALRRDGIRERPHTNPTDSNP